LSRRLQVLKRPGTYRSSIRLISDIRFRIGDIEISRNVAFSWVLSFDFHNVINLKTPRSITLHDV